MPWFPQSMGAEVSPVFKIQAALMGWKTVWGIYYRIKRVKGRYYLVKE